jgi:hypothetical protein
LGEGTAGTPSTDRAWQVPHFYRLGWEGSGFSLVLSPSSVSQGKSYGEPGRPLPLPVQVSRPPRPPQMAVSQRTVCCRRQGGVPDLRGSGPRRQLGRMGMLSCLQRPRSGRWRALISLHTQRLRSITSRSLPSRSRAGGGGRASGSGSGSAGWICASRKENMGSLRGAQGLCRDKFSSLPDCLLPLAVGV